jgi:two-component system, cell cycle response regulator DivK
MPTIVHIEDDDAVAHIVRSVLARDGYTVVRAANAADGIQLVYEYEPVLVIVDMWLPEGLDGWAATSLIKEAPQLAHIPIVALTAQSSEESRQRAFRAGCAGYVPKPFEIRHLTQVIREILGD